MVSGAPEPYVSPMGVRGRTKVAFVLLCVATLVMGFGVRSAQADVFVPAVPDRSWSVNGTVYAVATVGDRVYVGGFFSTATSPSGLSAPRANLAAFDINTGELLTSWRADVAGAVIALASDGTSLWVGGSFSRIGNQNHGRIAKVALDTGAPDASFQANADANVRAIDVVGSSLYLGGNFATMNGASATRLAKVNAATGQLDTTFTASANAQVNGVKMSPVDPILYVAGDYSVLSGTARNGIGAVRSTTGATTGPVFANTVRPYLGLDINEDGTRLFGAGGGGTNSAVAWNTTTGVRVWRQVADGDIQAIRYFNGMVYFGFHDGFQGDTRIKLLAADAFSGLIDPNFKPTFDRFWGVYTIAISGKGLIAGGDFSSVAGVPAQGWVRFRNQGAPPPPPPTTVRYIGSLTPWSYWDRGSRPAGWEGQAFNHSAWPTGTTQLGYGDGDESTIVSYGPSASSKYITTYFRTLFEVTEMPEHLNLGLLADDGAVVYLNGVEVTRDNMPSGTITDATRAVTGRSGGDENAIRPFTLPVSRLHTGTNLLAVEVHQDSASSSDLSFDADLTGQMPAGPGPDPDPDPDPGPGPDPGPDPGTPVQSVLVANGASWQWRYNPAAPPSTWTGQAFDASSWTAGAAPLGWGSGIIATNIDSFPNTQDRPRAAYFRKTFTVADPSKVTALTLHTWADDGVVVHVNGSEVGRANVQAGPPSINTYALTAPSTSAAQGSPLDITVPPSALVAGTNVIAVETHLNYRGTRDLSMDLRADITAYPSSSPPPGPDPGPAPGPGPDPWSRS